MKQPETIKINDVEYVRADRSEPAEKLDGLEYCIVRTYSAGVFAGYVKERSGQEATVLKARRIYYWAGAATLSQLATDGTKKPSECKFPVEVEKVILTNVIEIIPTTEKARKSISEVKVWEE